MIPEGGNATYMILCFYIAASYKQYIIYKNGIFQIKIIYFFSLFLYDFNQLLL